MKRKSTLLFLICFFAATSSAFAESRPIVEQISARATDENSIEVSWILPNDFSADSIVIFRSTKQISKTKGIPPLKELSPDATSFTDKSFGANDDGEHYFYCALAKIAGSGIFETIIPSVNSTVRPVSPSREKLEETAQAEEKIYPAGQMREIPLPSLDLINDLKKKPNITDTEKIRTAEELSKLSNKPKPKSMRPYIFEEDKRANKTGDDYYLQEIVKTYFQKKNYKAAAIELNSFLSMNRSPQTTARAAFYIGETQYFLGKYKNAVSFFLFAEEDFPSLARKWIDASLDKYQIPAETN